MKRLLLVALFVALTGACTGAAPAQEPVPTSTACAPTLDATAAPGSTGTVTAAPGSTSTATALRATPEQTVCTLYAHLEKGDCEAVLSDVSDAGVAALVQKAGGRDKLCAGLAAAANDVMKRHEFVAVAKKSESATEATVVLAVRDKTDQRITTSVVTVVKVGDGWKIKDVPVL